MRLARHAVALLLLAALAPACVNRSQTGPETDAWARPCAADDDCPGALDCLCGLCTETCVVVDGRTGCPFGTCLNASQIDRCPADASVARLCGVRCVEDAECKNLGATYVCVTGICARNDDGTLERTPDVGSEPDAELDIGAAPDAGLDAPPDAAIDADAP